MNCTDKFSCYLNDAIEMRNRKEGTLFAYICILLVLVNILFDRVVVSEYWTTLVFVRIALVINIYIMLQLYKKNKIEHIIFLLTSLFPAYVFLAVAPELIMVNYGILNTVNFTIAFVMVLFPSLINTLEFKDSLLLNVVFSILIVFS